MCMEVGQQLTESRHAEKSTIYIILFNQWPRVFFKAFKFIFLLMHLSVLVVFVLKLFFKLCLTSWIGYRINYLVNFEKLSNFVDNLFYCLQLGGAGRGVTLSAQGNSLKPKVSIGQYCFIQRFFWTCSDSSLIIYLSFCIHLCICNWQSSNAK